MSALSSLSPWGVGKAAAMWFNSTGKRPWPCHIEGVAQFRALPLDAQEAWAEEALTATEHRPDRNLARA